MNFWKINCDSSLFCFQNPNTASRCLTWCQPQLARILFPLHFVSKYESAKNCSRKNVIVENIFDLQIYRSSYRLVHMAAIWLPWRCFGFTVSPGTHRGPNCHCFHRNDWAQQSGRPQPIQHLKMDGWKTTYSPPFWDVFFGRCELLVSRGCNFPGVVFFFGR